MGSQQPLSESELAVLKALWDNGEATVRALLDPLREAGRSWAYTTLQTLLNRLEVKGYVSTERSGTAVVYRALVDREGLLKLRLHNIADDLCEGETSPLMLALVDAGTLSSDEIQALRQRLDELEGKRPSTKKGG